MASTIGPETASSPAPGGGRPGTSTLTAPILLAVAAVVAVFAGRALDTMPVVIPLAGLLLLCAYGLFMRWVRLHAATGNGFVRFLEQIRRAIAFESPDQPSR